MKRPQLTSAIAPAAAVFAALLGSIAPNAPAAEPSKPEPTKRYMLEKAPAKATDVAAIRKNAKDQQDVTVVGRVGGRKSPWVKNTAAFSIVDRSLKACNERPDDTCPTPWDFCCEADLPKYSLLVLVPDSDGKPVKKDARDLLGLKELDTVVIQGKAKRDKTGNVTIMASKMYVTHPKNSKQEAPAEKKETAK
jgi:hypothetical protein